MEVHFKTVKLRRRYERFEQAARQWGETVARRYVQRINDLYASRSIQDLRMMPPLRFHELKGDRAGQYAIALTDRMRLIVSFPDKERGTVLVEEVSKHYGD